MRKPLFLLAAFVFVVATAPSPSGGAEAVAARGKVVEVTLYQGQALVTRAVPLDAPAGSHEVLVGDLPESVVPDSLFAEGDPGIDVRAVRFRSRAVGAEPREEVRKLEEALEAVKGKLELNGKRREAIAKKAAYLEKLEAFVAPTAQADLARGVLNAAELEKLTTFSFAERDALVAEGVKLASEARDLEEEAQLLETRRGELAARSSRAVREAVIFVEKSAAGAQGLRLSYLAGNCGWSPHYVFAAASGSAEISFEYFANVHQMTGEDWAGVTLTLSTASPALSASGPGLAPFHVALSAASQEPAKGQVAADVATRVRSIKDRQQQAEFMNRLATGGAQSVESSWEINAAANEYQSLELLLSREDLDALRSDEAAKEEAPSMSYALAGQVSLESRADQQVVRVFQGALKGNMYHVATPVLSSFVYREAEVANATPHDLLLGPVTAYLDGRFVGRTEIPTVARGQKFVVGFGADPQLRTRRELLSKTEGVQGGNKEITVKYALSVESYRDAPSAVRLFDRLPYSGRTGEIRVTLKDASVPLSEDRLYLRRERPRGILRWDVEVPAKAVGEAAKTVEYGYTVEYDRKFQLSSPVASPEAAPALRVEFEQLQRARAAASE
ncbi:MAG: mucoidy inhibitor MuiA family protein [Planctomycetota bacterium]